MLSSLMKILSAMVSLYTLVIIARIVMTWFHNPYGHGKIMEAAVRITDPYLNYFRRFSFLQIGTIDFSPVAALIVLSVAGNIFNSLAAFGRVTLGLVLALFLSAVWSAVAFFLGLFLILIVLRAFGIVTRIAPASPFWRTLDSILNPVLHPIISRLLGGRNTTYLRSLLIGGAAMLGARIFGDFLVHHTVLILQKLPF